MENVFLVLSLLVPIITVATIVFVPGKQSALRRKHHLSTSEFKSVNIEQLRTREAELLVTHR